MYPQADALRRREGGEVIYSFLPPCILVHPSPCSLHVLFLIVNSPSRGRHIAYLAFTMRNIHMNIMELAAENAMRLKAIHIGGILAREAATSGRLTHVGHPIPLWLDPPFPVFPDLSFLLTEEQKAIEDWLASHKPHALSGLPRARLKAKSQAFPILTPVAKARHWLDKIVA